MDLVEASGGTVTPVDYKHGDPHETDKGIELWPADKLFPKRRRRRAFGGWSRPGTTCGPLI